MSQPRTAQFSRIIGIDPGSASGAVAFLMPGCASVCEMPTVNKQVDAVALARLVSAFEPDAAVIELVASRPGQGVASVFKFGKAAGLAEGVIAGARVPLWMPTPQRWKHYFRLNSDGERSRQLAIQRFPSVTGLSRKKDHNAAEALLLALWLQETGGER